MIPFTQQGG